MSSKNNFDIDVDLLSRQIVDERDKQGKSVQHEFSNWIEHHGQELHGLNFDLLFLNKLYVDIKKYSPPYDGLIGQLRHLLQVEEN